MRIRNGEKKEGKTEGWKIKKKVLLLVLRAYSLSVILGVQFTIGSSNVTFLHENVFHTRILNPRSVDNCDCEWRHWCLQTKDSSQTKWSNLVFGDIHVMGTCIQFVRRFCSV